MASDARALTVAIAADEEVDRALKAADELSDDAAAASLLESRAIPAAERAVAAARGLAPESPWGKATREALISLASDRRNEIPRYAAALRSGEPSARLAALQQQIAIEKRALALAGEVSHPKP